jgi:hypothetical protein
MKQPRKKQPGDIVPRYEHYVTPKYASNEYVRLLYKELEVGIIEYWTVSVVGGPYDGKEEFASFRTLGNEKWRDVARYKQQNSERSSSAPKKKCVSAEKSRKRWLKIKRTVKRLKNKKNNRASACHGKRF